LTVSLLSEKEGALTVTYANEKDISIGSSTSNTTMTSSTLQEDEPESDDQGMRCNTPLTSKPGLKGDGDVSSGTLLTSPTSSRKSYTYLNDSSIAFNDNVTYFEIDCEYTEAQVSQLWFTKTEYDDFLQACDEDAQKCEAHEQETRVAKVKKEIKKAQRQKRRKEKRHQKQNNQSRGGIDSVLDSSELDMDDDIIDDGLDEETTVQEEKPEMNEDEQGWLCSLGLEAWTLEGYQIREHRRQKAVDSVLNEQYAAWDNGKVENSEMMSAMYFAASASSKQSASKKGKELEVDVQEYTLVSTLEDYNETVQILNVLQKSLHCIKSKKENENNRRNSRRESRSDRWKTGTARRGSNASTESMGASSFIERALAPANEHENEVSEVALMSTIVPDLKHSTIKINSNNSKKKLPPLSLSASSSCRKKITRGTPKKMHRTKAGTNFQVAPPTPPVVKARRIEYKPAMAPALCDMLDPPKFKSPKNRKIVYKSQSPASELPPKHASTKISSGDRSVKSKKKREKESHRELRKEQKGKVRSERVRSKSPRPISLSPNTTETTKRSSKTPRRVSLSTSATETTTRRSKSPCPVSMSTTKSPRDSSAKRDSSVKRDSSTKRYSSTKRDSSVKRDSSTKRDSSSKRDPSTKRDSSSKRDSSPRKHSKSKSPRRTVTKSVVSKAPKIEISVSSDTSSTVEISSSSHTAHMTTRKSKKKHKRDKHNDDDEKEHWWFQEQKEAAACQ